ENKLNQLSDLEKQRDEIRTSLHRIELTRENLLRQLNGLSGGGPDLTDNQRIIELRNEINRLNDRYIRGGQADGKLRDSISYLREQLRLRTMSSSTTQTTPTLSKAEIQNSLSDLDVEQQVARTNLNTVEAKIRSLEYS